MLITKAEQELLEAIRDLEYGQLVEVNIFPGSCDREHEVTAPEACLLLLLRGGERYFRRIVVTAGRPVHVEVPYLRGDMRGLKTIKLIS